MGDCYKITDTWCQHIPLLHRLLADPTLKIGFPSPMDAGMTDQACSVWETLHYLLRYLLGWNSPGSGLAWWYAEGKPIHDSPLLRTLSQLWDRDGELDYYAAWAWTQDMGFPNTIHDSPSRFADESQNDDLQWWREFLDRPKPRWADPFHGGTNPLHLGHSDWFGCDELKTDRSELHHDLSTRQAMLIVNNIGSWRRDLKHSTQRLPDLGERSWHVQVFDRQHGYLGTFRRSRETGLWFQGKHRIHAAGHQLKPAEY